jgi:omega-hydroxy-beta-dihydromenaquinone-9 sulfotransferase
VNLRGQLIKMAGRLRLSLDAWRSLVGKIDRQRSRMAWHTHLSYGLTGASYSLLTRIQDASHQHAIASVLPSPPLFLLGFWRSGTTFLHELFCCDPQFGFPSTFACLNPFHFLLTESWVRKRASGEKASRPMDDVRYSWASPQEDEFALLALGAPSPYEALLFPSLMRNPETLLDLRLRSRDEQDRWAEMFKYFLRLLTVQKGKTMVLKSPPHGFRLPMLPLLFPESQYVILERNPYEVFASNLKLWRTLLDLYSLEPYSEDEIESFVLAAYVIHEEALAEGIRPIGVGSLTRVRYEELVNDPVGQMRRMYQELGLANFETVKPQLEQHLAEVAGHTRNRFVISPEQKARVDSRWGRLIEAKGYRWPADHVSLQ